MSQGIGKCMTTELTSLTPSTTQFEVVASPCEKFSFDRRICPVFPQYSSASVVLEGKVCVQERHEAYACDHCRHVEQDAHTLIVSHVRLRLAPQVLRGLSSVDTEDVLHLGSHHRPDDAIQG